MCLQVTQSIALPLKFAERDGKEEKRKRGQSDQAIYPCIAPRIPIDTSIGQLIVLPKVGRETEAT